MPSTAAGTIVLYDAQADRVRTLEEALTARALACHWVSAGGALASVRPADDGAIALVSVDSCPHAASPACDAITKLRDKGYIVLCYGDGASEWALGAQCRLLLAGAVQLLDSRTAAFGRELGEHVTRLLHAECERRGEEGRLRQQMRGLGMVGDSASISGVFRWILRVSPLSDITVLICGETGTGKELVARSIHRLDPRRAAGPFIPVNCGAISAGLAESELFGHRRGAFTGADHDRTGLVRAARGGVLFLDEIGDLDIALQGTLLRVLQEHRVLALGDDHEVPVNVRIIAATNRNLEDMVREHTFRADLFHRLNVLSIRLPALRERMEDLEPLVRYFVARSATRDPSGPIAVSNEFIQALRRIDLPGNVRQLENIVRVALVTRGRGEPLRLSDLPPEIWQKIANAPGPGTVRPGVIDERSEPIPNPDAAGSARHRPPQTFDLLSVLDASSWRLGGALDLCERQILTAALDVSSGNRSRAARLLGISARSIFNKMRKHHLAP